MSQSEPSNINHSDRDHAEYGPSGLKMHATCSGFVPQNEEGKDMSAAKKGTRIHEALEIRDPQALHDEDEHNIYETIVRMEDAFLSNFPEDREDINEVRVDIDLDGNEGTFGTFDRLSLWESQPTFAVLGDYKTGVSVIDPAYKNMQAKAYTIGLFQKYPALTEITAVFYVPFHDGDTVSEGMYHTFSRAELPELKTEITEVITKAKATVKKWSGEAGEWPSPSELCPSDNCRFCEREEHGCPALGGLILDVYQAVDPTASETMIFDPESDDPDEIQKRFLIAKIVGAWADREKKRAVAQAKDGMEFPGLYLRSMGRVTRITDAEQLPAITGDYGLPIEDLVSLGSFPFKKVKEAVAVAGEGNSRDVEAQFIDACENAGILSTSEERFTLAEKK